MSMVFIWLIVCGVAILLELATPTIFVSIWFAVGAIIGALAALIHLPLWAQLICFIVVSLVSMLVVRPFATHYLKGNTVPTNADRCIGKVGVVQKEITPFEWGEVKVGSTLWHAIAIEGGVIAVDRKVEVVKIEGAKLLVKEIEEKKEGL